MSTVVLERSAVPNTSNTSLSVNGKTDFHDSGSSGTFEVAKEAQGVDVVVGLFAGHAEDSDLDPEVVKKLRKKLDWHILPLLFLLYTLQFLDKNTLGASSILGIIQDNHLSTNQFNNLASAFYVGYIIFVWPHSWLMQRFPIGKYIAANIFSWSILIGLHALCHSFGGLFALRFLLGASEGCITSGIMTIISMFYTRTEIGERLGWTIQCNGIAAIMSGFIAFGLVHIDAASKPARWQWIMIIWAIISLITSVLFFLYFPDNPASARFLTHEEKVMVVQRIKANQSGIETKVWKKAQFIEALTDIKTWYFSIYIAAINMIGGIGVQYSIIIKDFGFSTLETTVANIPSGVVLVIAITTGGIILRKFPNARCLVAIRGLIPAIMSCFLLIFLPRSKKVGLLIAMYIMQINGVAYVMILSWCTVTVAGHTKKMTTNAVVLIGHSLGLAVSSQPWKLQYRPRNVVPWSILLASFFFALLMSIVLRVHFDRENKRRDRLKLESGKEYEEFGYVERVGEDGETERIKVPIALLDITDKENMAFRYVL